MPRNIGSTKEGLYNATKGVKERHAPLCEQQSSSEISDVGLSVYWRKNTSNIESIDLANLLRALCKVAGHLGPNAGSVEYLGMSRGGLSIVLDPAIAIGRYPVPPPIVDLMVGLTAHEALHRIVWSDHVWKLLETVFSKMSPRHSVGFQKLIRTGEDIYVDQIADRSILGLYVEKARNAALREIGKKLTSKEPSVDELVYLWCNDAWGKDPASRKTEAYRKPLKVLQRLTDNIRQIVTLDTDITEQCRRRANLYSEAWKAITDSVSSFKLIDKQLYWYPSASEPEKEGLSPNPANQQSKTVLSPYLAEQIQMQLAAYSADITPIIRQVAGCDDEDIAPTSRWDFNIPAHPVIDRKLVSRVSSIFSNYAERKKVVSRGLVSGKLDRHRLYRAPMTGRCFQFVDMIPDPAWTVTLLLDASGSMRGSKWRMVENTVGNLHAALSNSSNSLQAYAYFEIDGVCMLSSLIQARRLLSVPPGGRTASGQAIIAAAYLMSRRRQRNLLIHVTDGESNFGCDVRYGIDYCREQNIHLVTLGCGYKDRAAMLAQYGKAIQFIDHFGQLPHAIENLLKWTFIYGKKPHLWGTVMFDIRMEKEGAYENH